MAMVEPLTRERIEEEQLQSLRALWRAIVPGNAFQTSRLRAAGAESEARSVGEWIQRCPFTVKRELVEDQRRHPPYGTNLTFPAECYTRYHQTSATTAAPLRWLDTPESWQAMVDCWKRVLGAAGVTRGDRVFFAFSFGPFLGFWTAFDAASQLGCMCIPGGAMSTTARLAAMLDNEATVLCCTPTYAQRLGETARQEGVDLSRSRLRAIIVGGEAGGSIPATRARIEATWPGARVWDHHGMTEVGPVSYECPAHPGRRLHVMESSFIAEVIDPATGQATSRGERGELVLTTLKRLGSPLVRYRTGDLVRVGARGVCACGSHEMALEGGILGRCDDMVNIRGVNVYPAAVEEIVRSLDEIAEYRVEVSSRDALAEMRVVIEPVAGCVDAGALARQLESALRGAMALRVPVEVASPGTLPRFEMKARRWVVA